MSTDTQWMPLYIGDYLGDTMHLSGPEHGAYLLLMMHSWRTGPLPKDSRALASIARTEMASWRRMEPTILAFFEDTGSGFVQGRLERERQRQQGKIEQRRAAGLASAAARSCQRKANDRSTTVGVSLEQTGREPEPEPEPEEKERPNPSGSPSARAAPRPKATTEDRHFADFWAAYPRKVGKDAARKAWAAAVKRAPVATIAAGLNSAKWPSDRQFIPHPATWLNQGRWQDEPADAAPEPAGKLDWLREYDFNAAERVQ